MNKPYIVRNWGMAVLGIILGTTSLPAAAQESLGIKLAPGLRVYPALEVRGIYDGNFFYAPDDEESEFATLVAPSVGFIQDGNRSKFEAGASGELAEFDDQVESDYIDGVLFASGEYLINVRNKVSLRAERNYGHDPFGLRRSELDPGGVDRGVDEFTRNLVRGGYNFGAENARFNLRYEALFINKNYTTNRDLGTRFLQFERLEHIGSVIYNYSPRTALILQGRLIDLEYDQDAPGRVPRSFQDDRILVGGSWRATSKTSGRVLIGRVHHDPDDPRRNEFSEFDWEAQVDWVPAAKTAITLNAGRQTDDSFRLDAAFINTETYSAAWSQRWAPRFSSRFVYSYSNLEFEGIDRSDDFQTVNLEGAWLLRRELALVSTFTYLDRNSDNDSRLDFGKEIFSIGIRYTP